MQFENTKFDWKEWNVPIITTPLELRKTFEEMKLSNRVIKSMRFLGCCYNEELGNMTIDYKNDDDETDRYAEIDQPLIIQFEDGDVFALDFSDFSTVKCGLNTIPHNVEASFNPEDVDANILFSDLIGGKIDSIGIEDTDFYNSCEHTGSHGFEIDENQDQYIAQITFYINNTKTITSAKKETIYYQLVFYVCWDYGEVYEKTFANGIQKIKYKELKKMKGREVNE